MRSLIKNLQKQTEINTNTHNGNFVSSAPSGGIGGNNSHAHEFGSSLDTSKIKQEPGLNNDINGRNNILGNQFDEFSTFSTNVLDTNLPTSSTSSILNLVSEQKNKKRKHDKHSWKSSKRKSTDECEIVLESSSNDSNSLEAPPERDAEEEMEQDVVSQTKPDEALDVADLEDVDEVLKMSSSAARNEVKKKQRLDMKKSPSHNNLLMDLTEGKSLIAPSVTITPITSSAPTNLNSVLTGMGLDRRPGIEIIPISSAPASNLMSSITITPITSTSGSKDDRKSKSKSSDEKLRLEKKRKRKREEGSKMGPPEKVPPKNDPLTKPVSVSIKPATDSPPGVNRPNSPSVRKYNTSPTPFSKSSNSSKPHQNLSPKHTPTFSSSPKHSSGASPKHGTSSPKQPSSGSGKPSMSALKSAASSPTSSKNSEGKVKSSSSKESRDPSRKTSSGSNFSNPNSSSNTGSPKIKSSSVKLKQLDLSADLPLQSSGNSGGNSSSSDSKNSGGNPLQRNRKGSLSAVIDKLKSAQEVVDVGNNTKRETSNGSNGKESRNLTVSSSAVSPKPQEGKSSTLNKVPDGVKNPTEYMVKPSLDGMKITINKTRTKESSKSGSKNSGSSSGSGSPKTHTGLKPGVISGPASKKPHVTLNKPMGPSSTSTKPSNASSVSKTSSGKNSSVLSKSSKGSSSPKIGTGLEQGRKDSSSKSRPVKSSNERGIFNKDSGSRKGSPAPLRDDDHDRTFKNTRMEVGLPAAMVVEGLTKHFDKNFQIPKLSARNNSSSTSSSDDSKKQTEKLEIKVIDLASSKGNLDVASNLKYQSSLPKHEDRSDRMAKTPTSSVQNLSLPMALTTVSPKLPMTSPNLPTTSLSSITSKLDRHDEGKTEDSKGESRPQGQTVLTEGKAEAKENQKTDLKFQTSLTKCDDVKTKPSLLIPTVPVDSKVKPAVTTPQEAAEILLDFSSCNTPGKSIVSDKSGVAERTLSIPLHRTTPPPPSNVFQKPNSPVTTQFTKSPTESPLIMHSPQSMTDDELMDEALMLRK